MALLETLQDDFSNATTSGTKWTQTPAGAISYASGAAVMSGSSNRTLDSTAAYDFDTNTKFTYLSAKVARAGEDFQIDMMAFDPNTLAQAGFRITSAGDLRALIFNAAGNVLYYVTVSTYNPATMAYLRIRTASNAVHFGYSADGNTWTETTWTGSFGIGTPLKARFIHTGQSAGNTTTIDDVNILPPSYTPTSINDAQTFGEPAVVLPLLETLQDDFSVPATSITKWTTFGTAAFTGGTAVLTGSATSYFVSKATYTCDTATGNSYLSAKMIPTGASTKFEMKVQGADGLGAATLTGTIGGNLFAEISDPAGSRPYSKNVGAYIPATMAYLRIRSSAGNFHFGYSADGNTWTENTYTGSFGVGLQWLAYFFNYSTTAANVVTVDNVNILPPPPSCAPTSINDAQTVPAPAASLPIERLQDDFTTGPLDTAKWSTTGIVGSTATVAGGTLNIATAAGLTNPIGSVRSVAGYSFTGSGVFARVVPDPTAAGQTTHLRVIPFNASNEVFYFIKTGGNLGAFGCDTTGNVFNSTTITYDPAAHAWWKIRHTAGTIYWETSPDGLTWTIRLQAVYAPQVEPYRARMYTQWTGTSTAGTVSFDNVNIAPPYAAPTSTTDVDALGNPDVAATTAATPDPATDTETLGDPTAVLPTVDTTAAPDSLTDAETLEPPTTAAVDGVEPFANLTDDFTTLDQWQPHGTGTTADVTGGTLNLTTTAGLTKPVGGVTTVNVYDLIDSYIFAKVTTTGAPTGEYVLMVVAGQANPAERFSFTKQGTNLLLNGYNAAGGSLSGAVVPYSATTMAWWRIRHTGGVVYMETSPDSTTWTIRKSWTYTPSVHTMQARMEITWSSTSSATTMRYDNVNIDSSLQPDPAADPETLDSPDVTFTEVVPDPIVDPIADPETLDGPDLVFAVDDSHTPDSIEDPEELQGLDVGATDDTGPDPIGDPEGFGNPGGAFTADAQPDAIGDTETFGPPAAIRNNNVIIPDSIADPGTLGDVQALVIRYPQYFPNSIVDVDLVFRPDSLIFREISNWNYGEGIYSDGPYSGSEPIPEPPTPDEIDNLTYGTGTYGYGIYYGTIPAPLPDDPEPTPLLSDIAGLGQPPLHILGIGPWSPTIVWRGLPNYFIDAGKRPARPAMALPPATSKGFTLRLAEGSEARIDLAMRRGQAIVIDEMDTDLWWRRKDPRTKRLEVIGRFNCSHIEMSTSDTGVNMSAQFEDYVTVLGARMVLKYLNPNDDPPTSIWDIHTPVTDILAFALPDNTGLDLSEATGARPYPLGNIIQPYDLPPSTTIADLMANLIAISPVAWEWWIETPADVNLPPKLRFTLGERGSDKGVTLLDAGSGPTPIAAWTKNGAADNYANSLYYTGVGTGTGKDAGGGVVEQIPAAIAQYGQRDALYGSTTQGGDIDQIKAGAVRKLDKLADRKPTYTITLTHGFWRGRNHIDVGDTVTLILRLNLDVTVTKYRVSEITVAIDDNGMEDVTLTLGKPRASNDPRSSQSPFMRLLRTLKNYEAPSGAATIPPPED